MKLHGADWNDAMDMAWENGESVAFTCAYAGNMKNIAEYLRKLQEKEMFDRIEVAEEMEILFTGDRELYESPEKKQQLLRQYTEKCAHDISGNTIVIRLDQLSRNLDEKADWMIPLRFPFLHKQTRTFFPDQIFLHGNWYSGDILLPDGQKDIYPHFYR